MFLLRDPYLDLIHQYIETNRCIIVPFSMDGRVDIRELAVEFCKANKDNWINDTCPLYEEEVEFVKNTIAGIGSNELFENFIIDKESGDLIGTIGLNNAEEDSVSIGLWIRESEQGKGYGTEAYAAMLSWAKKNLAYKHLRHTIHIKNEASGRIALKFGGILQTERPKPRHLMFHIPL